MGWFKSLKKKLSIQNVLKGAQSVLKVVPGGNIISEGLKITEKAFTEAGKVFGKKPESRGVSATTTAQTELSLVQAKSSNNTLILIGIAGVVAFFLFKGK